jgi:hypothetical protein
VKPNSGVRESSIKQKIDEVQLDNEQVLRSRGGPPDRSASTGSSHSSVAASQASLEVEGAQTYACLMPRADCLSLLGQWDNHRIRIRWHDRQRVAVILRRIFLFQLLA